MTVEVLPEHRIAARHLDDLRRVIGSDRAIADMLDVSPSQITRWRKGQAPDPENADRLGGLTLIVEMLARWLHPDIVEEWLTGPNLHLDGRTPAFMLRRGRVADIIGAIEAGKAGTLA